MLLSLMPRTFGEALKTAREKAGIKTQEELARRMHLSAKSGQSNVAALETRQFPPTRKTVLRIVHAIPCEVADLLDDVITPWGLVLSRSRAERESAPKGRASPPGQRPAKSKGAGSS